MATSAANPEISIQFFLFSFKIPFPATSASFRYSPCSGTVRAFPIIRTATVITHNPAQFQAFPVFRHSSVISHVPALLRPLPDLISASCNKLPPFSLHGSHLPHRHPSIRNTEEYSSPRCNTSPHWGTVPSDIPASHNRMPVDRQVMTPEGRYFRIQSIENCLLSQVQVLQIRCST